MQRSMGAGAEVTFLRRRFPQSKVGATGTLEEEDDDGAAAPAPTRREIVAQEAANLVMLQKRLSVRDLASKFEQGQTAASAAAKKVLDEVCCLYRWLWNWVLSETKLCEMLILEKFGTVLGDR